MKRLMTRTICTTLVLFMSGLLSTAQQAASAASGQKEKTSFQTRGQWKPSTDVRSDVAIVYGVKGRLIDLFDPALPVLDHQQINPGEQGYLFNIGRVAHPETPQVLAAASRVDDEKIGKGSYSFTVKSPLNTTNVMRVLLPAAPKKISVTDAGGKAVPDLRSSWEALGKTSFLSFGNDPNGIKVVLEW